MPDTDKRGTTLNPKREPLDGDYQAVVDEVIETLKDYGEDNT